MANTVAKLWSPELDVGDMREEELLLQVYDIAHRHALIAVAVTHFKRRLGAVETGALSKDKKVARKTASALHGVMNATELMPVTWEELREEAHDGEVMAAASIVRWDMWLPYVAGMLTREAVVCATFVMKRNLGSVTVKLTCGRLDQTYKKLMLIHGD